MWCQVAVQSEISSCIRSLTFVSALTRFNRNTYGRDGIAAMRLNPRSSGFGMAGPRGPDPFARRQHSLPPSLILQVQTLCLGGTRLYCPFPLDLNPVSEGSLSHLRTRITERTSRESKNFVRIFQEQFSRGFRCTTNPQPLRPTLEQVSLVCVQADIQATILQLSTFVTFLHHLPCGLGAD